MFEFSHLVVLIAFVTALYLSCKLAFVSGKQDRIAAYAIMNNISYSQAKHLLNINTPQLRHSTLPTTVG